MLERAAHATKDAVLFAGGLAIGAGRLAVETAGQVTRATVGTTVDLTLDLLVPRIVDAVLARVDLTALVVEHVDVDAIVAQADVEPIIDRLPLVTLADYIIDEIDLPQIIRESTGGIAVETMHAARLQAMVADSIIGRITDTVLFKRTRNTASPLAKPAATAPVQP